MSGMKWERNRAKALANHQPLQTEKQYLGARKPLTRKQARFIRQLRVELGDEAKTLPKTCREGRALIDQLLSQKRTIQRKAKALDREFDERLERAA